MQTRYYSKKPNVSENLHDVLTAVSKKKSIKGILRMTLSYL